MGKQSRRKGGGKKKVGGGDNNNRATRREQLQERKLDRIENAANNSRRRSSSSVENGGGEEQPRPFLKGDRVWFWDEKKSRREDYKTYRGIIQSIGVHQSKALSAEYAAILPISAPNDRRDLICRLPLHQVLADRGCWTLRFIPGDKVLCRTTSGWMPCTVLCQWPCNNLPNIDSLDKEDVEVFSYRCLVDDGMSYTAGEPFVNVKSDSDDDIMVQKDKLRFEVNDTVVIATALANGLSKRCRREPWLVGTVSAVDIIGRLDFYAAYECTVDVKGRTEVCHILHDNDEYIASINTSPRDRLLGSIEQNCSYAHIDYLITQFDIDTSPIEDLLLARSAFYGSYEGLAWLQENESLDFGVTDRSEMGLMSQIASSPFAKRFFKFAGEIELTKRSDRHRDAPVIDLIFDDSWLSIIVGKGDLHELEFVLSPIKGFAWQWDFSVAFRKRDFFPSLIKLAQSKQHVEMEKMLDEFVQFRILYQHWDFLVGDSIGSTSERGNEDGETVDIESPVLYRMFGKNYSYEWDYGIAWATAFIRFCRDWNGMHDISYNVSDDDDSPDGQDNALENIIFNLAGHGMLFLLQSLLEADSRLLFPSPVLRLTSENCEEYSQVELFDRDKGPASTVSLVSMVAKGHRYLDHYPSADRSGRRRRYVDTLTEYAKDSDNWSWQSYLATTLANEKARPEAERCYYYEELLAFKIDLLRDDRSLANRLAILDYLVGQRELEPLDILDTIRFRQCGVLRWLVDSNFVSLKSLANTNRHLLKSAGKMQFLGSRKIPPYVTVADYLCFAAVEYDDLQSLQWLIERRGAGVESLSINGWNLAHACAYFGRLEIITWLHTQSSWSALVSTYCGRKPWEKEAFPAPAHIAVDRGHVVAADLFIHFGCLSVDASGRTVVSYATKSKHKFVRDWGKERGRPLCLERDIERLLRLVSRSDSSAEVMKNHVTRTKCLDSNLWIECGFGQFYKPGPGGRTYAEILASCCSSNNASFIVWLCQHLSWPGASFRSYLRDGGFYCSFCTTPGLDCNSFEATTASAFISSSGDTITITDGISNKPWAKTLEAQELMVANPILDCLPRRTIPDSLLPLIQHKLMAISTLGAVLNATNHEIKRALLRGEKPSLLISEHLHAAKRLCDERGGVTADYLLPPVLSDGSIDLKTVISAEYGADDKSHAALIMSKVQGTNSSDLALLYAVLAIEGYHDLVRWCFQGIGAVESSIENRMVRISAYFGHSSTLELFLDNTSKRYRATSTREELFTSAMCGAAEAERVADLAGYLQSFGPPTDVFKTKFGEIPNKYGDFEKRAGLTGSSLALATVRGHLLQQSSRAGVTGERRLIMKLLIDSAKYEAKHFLYTIEIALSDEWDHGKHLSKGHGEEWFKRVTDVILNLAGLFSFLVQDLKLYVWETEIRTIVERIMEHVLSFSFKFSFHGVSETLAEEMSGIVISWLDIVTNLRLSIECFAKFYISGNNVKNAAVALAVKKAKEHQLCSWARFGVIKHGQPLSLLKESIEKGELPLDARYRGEMLMTHVAAAYDRVDILAWLIESKEMDLDALEGQNRTVLQLAEASKAPAATKWIRELKSKQVISSFIASHFHRALAQRRKQKMLRAVSVIQATYRGMIVRKCYRCMLDSRLGELQRFQAIWGGAIRLASNLSSMGLPGWSAIRESKLDMKTIDVGVEFEGLNATLQEAAESALVVDEDDEEAEALPNDDEEGAPSRSIGSKPAASEPDCNVLSNGETIRTTIQLSADAVKWLKNGDAKYRQFFVRRMKQLSSGDRSRILSKRLKGCRQLIYETYLEQKSGFRILWTPSSESSDNNSIIIWYIAKHKDVSRLMQLIDDSRNRSARQRLDITSLPEFEGNETTSAGATMASSPSEWQILLNPLGNTPLKLYHVPLSEIEDIAGDGWSPKLRLTDEERDVVEAMGTVLLLGRSGTGKTICICNRMDFDRQRHAHDPSFSQLFVARSTRLCRYVEETIGSKPYSKFDTFGAILQSLENSLPKMKNAEDLFLPSQHVEFARFKREICHGGASSVGLDPLVVWTHIRSFIKGSIEAVQGEDFILSKEEYEKLGKKRCRLSQEQREVVYDIFLQYQQYTTEMNLWDDCDRIVALLQRLEHAKLSDPDTYRQVRHSKIYVDEVQDYTQMECLLFFYLSGPGDLFFAGDPAQSVVEGVEFRFDEVRSVGHYVAGPNRRDLIPQKPKTVNVNFRSHSGILNMAAAVLRRLFRVFPGSAKQLSEDRGLFLGPRPGVFHRVKADCLSKLIQEKLNGVIVLTHDANKSHWKRALGGYPLVYGIRESKGLEFGRVIIVDFFASLPQSLQKPWRDLLLGRAGGDFNMLYPEIEGLLKLIYTAITRCIEQLFLAETAGSIAGDAFLRYATTTSTKGSTVATGISEHPQHGDALATKNNVNDVEAMIMTRDEWLSSGLDNAELAEEDGKKGDLSRSDGLLERAIYCFEQAKDDALARKARAHRVSVRFRSEMDMSGGKCKNNDKDGDYEVTIAQIVELLLAENLLLECRYLCISSWPSLSPYTRENLEHNLLSKLPPFK